MSMKTFERLDSDDLEEFNNLESKELRNLVLISHSNTQYIYSLSSKISKS